MPIFVPIQQRTISLAKHLASPTFVLILLCGALFFAPLSVLGSEAADSTIQQGGLTVDPKDRAASKAFFQNMYASADGMTQNWNGDYATCNEGGGDPAFDNALLRHVNYFRAMAGVPANITLNEDFNRKARKAALIMSANRRITHNVTPDMTCFSEEGKEGAANANLTNEYRWYVVSEQYIKDPGGGNYWVGHRRWLLLPQLETIGIGSVPAVDPAIGGNAIWVNDGNAFNPRPQTRDGYIAWPPPGFVPHQVTYARWSFGHPNANYDNTTVTMTKNGAPISVAKEQFFPRLSEDTLVWIPEGMNNRDPWPAVTEDVVYEVALNNVVIDGVARNFNYTVTIFNGAETEPTPTDTPAPTSTPMPTATPTSTFTPIPTETPTPTATPVPPTPTPTYTPEPDTDGDGISDAVECPEGGDNDMDNDGFLNCHDVDSDGDRILDSVEYLSAEVVGFGGDPRDSDGDGTLDYLDTDSDNDSVDDIVEAFDNDQNGLPDELEAVGQSSEDSNQNGLEDIYEENPNFTDTDRDELPNWRDPDDDNDGVSTFTEIRFSSTNPKARAVPEYLDSSIAALPPMRNHLYMPIVSR